MTPLGWVSRPAVSAAQVVPNMRRILAIGTSITKKWGDVTGAGKTRRIYGDSYLVWARTALQGRNTTMINAGVSGNTTTQMVARYATDVAARYAEFDTLIFEPGPNDYNFGLSLATISANIASIVGQAKSAKKPVILLTPTPTETATSAQQAILQDVRNWIFTTYGQDPMVSVIDVTALMADPLSGLPLAAFYIPTAVEPLRVHPSISGAAVIGRAIAALGVTNASLFSRMAVGQRDANEYIPNSRLQGSNASGARNFYAGAGVTVTGGPDSASISVQNGSFGSLAISPVVSTGAVLNGVSGGCRVAFGAAGADRSIAGIRFGSSDGGIGGTQYGRWDSNWVANTLQTAGDHRRITTATSGILTCITPGTTGGTQPSALPAFGGTVADGSVVWLWQKLPAAGDKFVAEVDYEIESQSGGFAMFMSATFCRAVGGSEDWGFATSAEYDTGATLPQGPPGLWMPRTGTLASLPITLEDPGVTLRHVFLQMSMAFMSAATATVRFDRASLRLVA